MDGPITAMIFKLCVPNHDGLQLKPWRNGSPKKLGRGHWERPLDIRFDLRIVRVHHKPKSNLSPMGSCCEKLPCTILFYRNIPWSWSMKPMNAISIPMSCWDFWKRFDENDRICESLFVRPPLMPKHFWTFLWARLAKATTAMTKNSNNNHPHRQPRQQNLPLLKSSERLDGINLCSKSHHHYHKAFLLHLFRKDYHHRRHHHKDYHHYHRDCQIVHQECHLHHRDFHHLHHRDYHLVHRDYHHRCCHRRRTRRRRRIVVVIDYNKLVPLYPWMGDSIPSIFFTWRNRHATIFKKR